MSPAKGCEFALDPDKVGTVHMIPRGGTGWACGHCGWAAPAFGWTILSNKEANEFELCPGWPAETPRAPTGTTRYD